MKYSSHSIRVWACVVLDEAGMPPDFIKKRLRWMGESYRVYLRDTNKINEKHVQALKVSAKKNNRVGSTSQRHWWEPLFSMWWIWGWGLNPPPSAYLAQQCLHLVGVYRIPLVTSLVFACFSTQEHTWQPLIALLSGVIGTAQYFTESLEMIHSRLKVY